MILVEGQEDVWGYRLLAELLSIEVPDHIFGWGAGGADKLPLICGLLDAPQYQPVACIVDKGKGQVAANIEKSFPSYSAFVSAASEVRTRDTPGAPPGFLLGTSVTPILRAEAVELLTSVAAAIA